MLFIFTMEDYKRADDNSRPCDCCLQTDYIKIFNFSSSATFSLFFCTLSAVKKLRQMFRQNGLTHTAKIKVRDKKTTEFI